MSRLRQGAVNEEAENTLEFDPINRTGESTCRTRTGLISMASGSLIHANLYGSS